MSQNALEHAKAFADKDKKWTQSIFADWRNSRAINLECAAEKKKLSMPRYDALAATFLRSPFNVIKSSRKEGTKASEQIEGIFILSANYERVGGEKA